MADDEPQEIWLPPLYPKQWDVMRACEPGREQNYVLVNGPRWASKCISPDSLVWTATGLKPIGHFGIAFEDSFSDINESVVSMHGNSFGLSKATQFYNSGTKDAICLRTDRGIEITCSLNHRLWSECDGLFSYRTAEHIRELIGDGEKVWVPLMREHPAGWPEQYARVNYFWKSKGHRRDFSVTIDEDIGYLMGLMVGDGCYTDSILRAHAAAFASDDPGIHEEMRRVITTRFPRTAVRHTGGCDFRIRGASFLEFLDAAGMAGKYAHEKTIPISIIHSPKSVLIAFLQGLFDTDGTVDKKGRIGYCTTSPQLSREVQTYLLALGIRSTRRFHKNGSRGAWVVSPQDEDNFAQKVGFRLNRKQARTGRIGKFKRMRSSYPPSLIPVLSRLHQTRKSRGVGTLLRKTHKHAIDPVLRGNTSLSKRRIVPLMDAVNGWGDSQFESYWMGGNVWWDSVATCESTRSKLVDIAVPGPVNFIGNGLINHNTFACHHAVCQHAWHTNHGNICILTVTQSVGVDSGVWQHLTELFLPLWIDNVDGMEWARKPYTQNVTKKPACEVTNKWGNKTRITLESLKNEKEVEGLFKGKGYSMFWINELSKFKQRKTFDTLKQQLRMPHLKDSEHLFLADTNPDLDLGTESWIYKLWYEQRTGDDDTLRRLYPSIDPKILAPQTKTLNLIEFSVDDNLSLSEDKKAQLMADFSHDPDLLRAYFYGEWVTASADALFFKVFRPQIHVLGELPTANNPEPEMLVPEENCSTLILGMDPGVTNCSAHILEKYSQKMDATGLMPEHERPGIKVLDEQVITKGDFDLRDFVEDLVERMEFWEAMCKGKVQWRMWSDRSVFDMKVAFSDHYWHQAIYLYSRGKISVMASERGPGSVRGRIDLTRKLFYEDRLYISKPRCPRTIEMVKSIKPGTRVNELIARGSVHKHPFDSMTYPIASELYDELDREVWHQLRMERIKKTDNESSLVMVPL